MGHRFAEIAFTGSVKEMQKQMGSRASYARMEAQPQAVNGEFGPAEASFIAARDSFYMATVSETGWPYLQHRGGPIGFIRILGAKTLGFADFRGNRQYVSVGNLLKDNRVCLFFMDYPNKRRLKMFGRVELIDAANREALSKLGHPNYRAKVERGFIIHLEAFDWNCPQHITERFTLAELQDAVAPLRHRIVELEAELKKRANPASIA